MVTVPDAECMLHLERPLHTLCQTNEGHVPSETREALEKEHRVVTRFGEQAFGVFFGQCRGSAAQCGHLGDHLRKRQAHSRHVLGAEAHRRDPRKLI